MKRLSFFIISLLVLCSDLFAIDVFIDLKDATLQSAPNYTNRNLRVYAMSVPTISGPSVILGQFIALQTDTNGVAWLSNAVFNIYQVNVMAPPKQEIFKFFINPTNYTPVMNANTNLVADATATFPAGSVAYAAAVTDARYMRGTFGVSPTLTTMTPTVLVQAEAGWTINNGTGISAIALTNTLPPATTLGTFMTFAVTAGHRFVLQCQPLDVVQFGAFQSSLGGQLINSGSTGDVATIEVVFPNVWYVISSEGSDWSTL